MTHDRDARSSRFSTLHLSRLSSPQGSNSVSAKALLGCLGLLVVAAETHCMEPRKLAGDMERILDDAGDAFPELLPFFRGEIGVGELHRLPPIRTDASRQGGGGNVGGDAEGDRLLALILKLPRHAYQHVANFVGAALHGHAGRLTESRRRRKEGAA
jgi:hypothetical protein